MRTYEEIENRREELEKLMSQTGLTEEIDREWKALFEEEKQIDMEEAIAICLDGDTIAFVRTAWEAGWAINTKVGGKWEYDDHTSIIDTMKDFANFARKNGIKTCYVVPWYLDINHLEEVDKKFYEWWDKADYAEACSLSEYYDDDSYLRRYYRNHGIEYDGE